jgi:hypothetical protein
MTSVGSIAGDRLAVHHKTARVNDLDVFYREAGSQNFALETHGEEIASRIESFLQQQQLSKAA